ncbi:MULTISPECIES: SHOCT domain-containing protein [Streptacidiphilus]|uniref:SHOCT domain-containing protein n=1 Tax=Streptacidiphilus cavernicola TaxID=3342716 RepID=A0ABV6UL40_9ACTN|nr:SHOCT domain-containing protein [Streptacidiphilus jeojiense]
MDWSDLVTDIAADALGDSASKRLPKAAQAARAAQADALPGEQPVALTACRGKDDWAKGALLVTTHRLLYLKEGRPGVPVPLTGITHVELKSTRLSGMVLKVVALSGAHRWEGLEEAEEFTEKLRSAIRAAVSASAPTEPAPPAGEGGELLDQLERLAALHDSGALDDAEFAAAKKRLLQL